MALDKASSGQQVQLLGNDGHHGAFNSLALASAKNPAGNPVGLSKASLEKDFAAYKKFVGIDERGEPNGAANEDARYLINSNSMLNTDLTDVMKAPQRITQRLNSVGITAILDAMTAPDTIAVFDALQQRDQLTVRVSLAQFYDPAVYHTAAGNVDYDAMVAQSRRDPRQVRVESFDARRFHQVICGRSARRQPLCGSAYLAERSVA